jgi:hypothetical protein
MSKFYSNNENDPYPKLENEKDNPYDKPSKILLI